MRRDDLASHDGPEDDALGAEVFAQPCFPGPRWGRSAMIEIEGREATLGERVQGQMGLGEQDEAGNASRFPEHVPHRFAKRMELELRDEALDQRGQVTVRSEPRRGAAERIDDVFTACIAGLTEPDCCQRRERFP